MLIPRIICNTTLHRLYRMMSSNHQLVLYGDDASPPVRFVRMTASTLNVQLEYRFVDIFKGENKTENYKKINPLQKIPALSIGDKVICDSHAIAMFLCDSSDDTRLYPKDHICRAGVNEMLFFNASTLFPIDSFILSAYFAQNEWPVNKEKINQWDSALDHLEYKLKDRAWLTGDMMYLCDLCVFATVTSMQTLIPVTQRHSRVKKWMKKFENLPCFDINKLGIKRLRNFIENRNLISE